MDCLSMCHKRGVSDLVGGCSSPQGLAHVSAPLSIDLLESDPTLLGLNPVPKLELSHTVALKVLPCL